MYGFPLQKWITIRGQSTVASIIQSESGYLDLMGFQDIIAYLEVREFNLGTGGTNVTLSYQTAPTKDEALFATMTAAVINLATGVTITKMLKETTTVPLSRWLRWKLAITGAPTVSWDANFRISIAANVGTALFSPQVKAMMPRATEGQGGCVKCNGGSKPQATNGSMPVGMRPMRQPTAVGGGPALMRGLPSGGQTIVN
jgi:hypothetical protein